MATLPLAEVCDSAMAGLRLPPSAAQDGVPASDWVGVVHLLPVGSTVALKHVLPTTARYAPGDGMCGECGWEGGRGQMGKVHKGGDELQGEAHLRGI